MMELIKDLCDNEFGEIEGKVYFKYFNKYIKIVYDKSIKESYVIKCVNYLNNLHDTVIYKICDYSLKFCKDMMKNYPDLDYNGELKSIVNPKFILNYIEVNRLKIDEYEVESCNVLNLSGSCAWDKENGFQWLIKDDEILYVGAWDDLNIWISSLDDEWSNYVL